MSSEGYEHCNIMRKYQNSRHIIKKILYYGARFTFSVVWRVLRKAKHYKKQWLPSAFC